ncbi:hypothetical protein O6H91_09G100700 [Diphasiastrum complanatum]|nr:hypothetical protein O6H91_09G100700 [Diphasiastrum complanatum]
MFCYSEAGEDHIISFSPDFSHQMTYLGDASYNAGTIELTLDPLRYSVYNSSGRALYSFPVRLLDPFSKLVASFSTTFSFNISPAADSLYGDGLAFIIVSDRYELGGYGFELGIYDQSRIAAAQHTFAVEFDTHQNVEIKDINDNHVGVDLMNATSLVAQDAAKANVILTDGAEKTAWIDYNGFSQVLEIRLANDDTRPVIPLISSQFNLSEVFDEFMFVGFSAATGGGDELHTILSWNFSTWGLLHSSRYHRSYTGLAAGLTLGMIVAAVVVAIIAWQALSKRMGSFRMAEEAEKDVPQIFAFKEINAATRNFSDAEKLGLGSVYRGVLPRSGAVVAVKRVACDPSLGMKAFLAEANAIRRLRHRNLVQLQGWCNDGVYLLLIYEFLPNGSVDRLLFDVGKDVLSWAHRYKIVCGIAAALLYLHEDGEQCIIHNNVKPSSVVLDHNFNARLGDFGFARIIQRHGSAANTVVAGTFGYIAPEAVQNGKATTKTDVFSFGAVVLEVGCGRRALDRSLSDDETVLVDRVWRFYEQGRILEAADPRLASAYDVQEMEMLLKLGLLCSHPDPVSRPSMRQVTLILSGDATIPPLPPSKPTTPYNPLCTVSIEHLQAATSFS